MVVLFTDKGISRMQADNLLLKNLQLHNLLHKFPLLLMTLFCAQYNA